MRWRLSRLGGRLGRAVPAAPAVPPVPAEPAPARPAWRSLPPLKPTIAVRPPLLVPTGRPDIASTRSLVAARPQPAGGDAPSGSVQGLAVPVAPRPPIQVSAAPVDRPRWAPPVRDRAPATPTELVHATDAYVGPAREPAVPHRAPGWLRGAMTPMQVPDFATGLPPALARMPVRPGPPDLPVPPALAPTAPPSPAEPVRARPVGPIRS